MGSRFDKRSILKELNKHIDSDKEIFLLFEFKEYLPLNILFCPYKSYLKIVNFTESEFDLVTVVTPYICLVTTLIDISTRVVTAYEQPNVRAKFYDLDIIYSSVELFFSLSRKFSSSLSSTYS